MIENIDRTWLVRPNLGNPLILAPEDLKRFTITIAYSKPWNQGEGTVEWPRNSHDLFLQFRAADYFGVQIGDNFVPFKVFSAHDYKRHSKYKDDYEHIKHAVTSEQQQYKNDFRWEVELDVGIEESVIESIKRHSGGWPSLLNIKSRTNDRINYHSLYIHEDFNNSTDFTILQITDTHIAKRYDKIPAILCSVRNEVECERLKRRYNNPNDNLRAFIQEANKRVQNGEKVVVVLTGDITDYYFDGYWDGGWVCGQGGQWADKRKMLKDRRFIENELDSNIRWFVKIVTGQDLRSEALQCPLFTIIGNHEYYANEILLDFKVGTDAVLRYENMAQYEHLRLSENEAREYDYYEYPTSYRNRSITDRKRFKEILNNYHYCKGSTNGQDRLECIALRNWRADLSDFVGDKSFWLIKPKSWILSQYLCEVNYDLDFEVKIGNKAHLLFLNTGHDLFPAGFWAKLKIATGSGSKYMHDYKNGPHCRGVTHNHLEMLHRALKDDKEKLVLVFTHAPIVQLQGSPDGTKIKDLYEETLDYSRNNNITKAKETLKEHYKDIWEQYEKVENQLNRVEQQIDSQNISEVQRQHVKETCKVIKHFIQRERSAYLNPETCPKGCFKAGTRTNLDFFCAEGWTNDESLDLSLEDTILSIVAWGGLPKNTQISPPGTLYDVYAGIYDRIQQLKHHRSIIDQFLSEICKRQRGTATTDKPVLIFSGHTHKTHEFRIQAARKEDEERKEDKDYYFFIDEYSKRFFQPSENAWRLLWRYGWLQLHSPLLLTSDSLRESNPQYRNVILRGMSLASLMMVDIDVSKFKPRELTGRLHPVGPVSFKHGCELVTLRAHNGQYVCAEEGGKRELVANRQSAKEWEIFELVPLGHYNKVALKACNGLFVRAEGGGGGKLNPDRCWIKSHETFTLVKKGVNKIALRAHNGKYVCAEGGGGRELLANRDWVREWETFLMEKHI